MTTTPGPQSPNGKPGTFSRIIWIGLAAIAFTAWIAWACLQMAAHVQLGDRVLLELTAAIIVGVAAAALGAATVKR